MARVTERWKLGAQAERLVARYLEEQGYEIVATNLRLGPLEIDLVARQGPLVAIVEVRTRGPTARTTGLGSVTPLKRERIRRAGERLWQRRYRRDRSVERLRFDLASVRLDTDPPSIEYVVAAF
ncbi:MAG TPA: YraN family protein [Polyangiaceae bacterium]|jgi:putative endonuclease|nr:YraN family protein [Polyangiaceae bacterium]